MIRILVFRRWAHLLCTTLAAVGAVALVGMMLLIVLDVTGRDLLDRAVLGTYEVVEYLMIPAVFLALGYGQLEDAHINVDVAIQFLSERTRAALQVVTLLLTLAVFLPMAWVSYQQAMQVYGQQLVSTVLLIPRWPFQAITLVGVLAFCLAVGADMLVAIVRAAGVKVDLRESGKVKLGAD